MMTLMPTPDELALKQQVTDTLVREGVLAKIKAELRAAVFRVMHERAVPLTADASAPKLSAFPEDVAATAVELIAECLAFFQWDHTLLVLRAEADLETKPLAVDGEKLAQRLKLDVAESVATTSAPVLLQLVEERLAGRFTGGGDELQKMMPSFGGGVLGREGAAAEHRGDDVKRELGLSSALSFSSMSTAKQQHEREDALDEEEEEEEPMEEVAERIDERLSVDSDRLTRESALESEDEDNRGGFRASVEEPQGGAGRFVQEHPVDDRSDGEEEYAANKPDQEDAGRRAEEEEEEEEELELEESMAEEIASGSEYEESRELASPVPPATRTQDQDGSDAGDQDDDRALLPPPVPTRLAPPHPLESLAPASTADEHEADAGARDDESDPEDEAARLSSLDAKLKAMEAEDDTGTLQQLKASLQLELQRGDGGAKGEEDEDGNGYSSSDFEEEEEITSEISEEVESTAEASDKEDDAESEREVSVAAPVPAVLMDDRAVENEDALNSYDYVEDVERPW